MKRIIALLALVLLVSGCASVQHTRLISDPAPKLSSSGSVYILAPVNAMYSGKEMKRSGKIMGNVIYSIFLRHFNRVEVSPVGEKFEEGFQKAKTGGFTYLINTKLLLWEDHATEWSGHWDRIDMQLGIYDVSSNKLLDSISFQGHGTWFTFGGYKPQHIVERSIDDYVDSLF